MSKLSETGTAYTVLPSHYLIPELRKHAEELKKMMKMQQEFSKELNTQREKEETP